MRPGPGTVGQPLARTPAGERFRPRRLRALVVEGDVFVAWHMQGMLQEIGLDVCAIASCGAEAIAMARDREPDVAVMDIDLEGGINGIEAARRIRALCNPSIVFMTAYADAAMQSVIEGMLPGVPVLVKPATALALRHAIGLPLQVRR